MRVIAAATLLILGLLAPTGVGAAEPGLDDPRLAAMARTVLADPAQLRRYVELARTQPEKAGAPILLLAGQYELGRGRFTAADRLFTQALAIGGEGPWRGPAESGLGWAALGRGDFAVARRHYAASELIDPATTLVAALLTAADGDTAAITALTELTLVPDLADLARLALGYAHLWTENPADAETAFATVTTPTLLDDAAYALAETRVRRGDAQGAETVLVALAELAPAAVTPKPSRALLALTPSAVLRSGLRRTRGVTILSQREQLATVLDGDGVSLARAALRAANGGRPARDAGTTDEGLARAPAPQRAAVARAPQPAPRDAPARPESSPRSFPLALWVLALLIALATWWIIRRRFEPGARRP